MDASFFCVTQILGVEETQVMHIAYWVIFLVVNTCMYLGKVNTPLPH